MDYNLKTMDESNDIYLYIIGYASYDWTNIYEISNIIYALTGSQDNNFVKEICLEIIIDLVRRGTLISGDDGFSKWEISTEEAIQKITKDFATYPALNTIIPGAVESPDIVWFDCPPEVALYGKHLITKYQLDLSKIKAIYRK